MRIVVGLLALALVATQTDPGVRFARDGDLEAAEREYRAALEVDPGDAVVAYNLGTILLMKGLHEEAREFLGPAAERESPAAGHASYNLGNTDLAPAFADSALPNREERLRRAIGAYRQALLTNPADDDARWNLELAQRLLDRESPPPSGGGGGGRGGQAPPIPGELDPAPLPSAGPGPMPDVERAEAEDLLRAARERELEIQRDRLRKTQPEDLRP